MKMHTINPSEFRDCFFILLASDTATGKRLRYRLDLPIGSGTYVVETKHTADRYKTFSEAVKAYNES